MPVCISTSSTSFAILGDDDRPVEQGQPGRVVVTDLQNYAMPFLRYAVEDVAIAGSEACPCVAACRLTQSRGASRTI